MRISLNWLKEFIEIDKTPEELADDLSMFGHEVENIEQKVDDAVLDFEITPNRGDCLSILGMAREIAALYNLKIKDQKSNIQIKNEKIDKNINIQIADSIACPRFSARIIENIEIKESSPEIKKRLESYGFRPINNIVDATNYAMVATGQPLHAFDYDKIKDGLMRIRLTKKNEEVITLDGKNHVLPEGSVIIEDEEKIYDLAGIMGGFKSEIDENTKTIVLQGAIFDSVITRKTAKYLRHQTDASYRYERGVDPEGNIHGIDLAAALIKGTCPKAKVGELVDKIEKAYKAIEIEVSVKKVNELIGINIDNEKATEYLERLGFEVAVSGELLVVGVPSYRSYDVKIWQDIAEEIARMYGYNKINKLRSIEYEDIKENNSWKKREIIKDICREIGFTEVYSYSFADKDKIELFGFDIESCVETSNPIAPELKFLRPSLLPSLLAQVAKNPWDPELKIFEIEKIFNKDEEKYQLGIALTGKNISKLKEIKDKLEISGEIQIIDQKVLDAYKIRRSVNVLISDLEAIPNIDEEINYDIRPTAYRQISKYPPTIRDLAFIVSKDIDAGDIGQEIKQISEDIIIIELFDEFESDKFGEGNKNIAYHIWLQDLNKPVSDKDADEIVNKIIQKIESKFSGKLRS